MPIKSVIVNGIDLVSTGNVVADFNLRETWNVLDNQITLPQVDLSIIDYDNSLSPNSPQSLFWGDNWYRYTVEITDDNDSILYAGTIKNVITTTSSKTVKFELVNSTQAIFDVTIQYARDIFEEITPAGMAKELLIINGLENIIHGPSFDRSIEYQKERLLYYGSSYYLDDNVKLSTALESLAYLSGSALYFTDGELVFRAFESDSDIRISQETFDQDTITQAPEIAYTEDYIINNYIVDVKDTGEDPLVATDSDFNNLGVLSRGRFGTRDSKKIELNYDTAQIFCSNASDSFLEVINIADSYIGRYKDNLIRAEFGIISSENIRYRLGDFIKINIEDSHYDLSGQLFEIISINSSEQNNTTNIVAIESLI